MAPATNAQRNHVAAFAHKGRALARALAQPCDHEFAFVPPARFSARWKQGGQTRQDGDPRVERYIQHGARICHKCGAWGDAEAGDVARYEAGDLKDITYFWGNGNGGGRRPATARAADYIGRQFGTKRVVAVVSQRRTGQMLLCRCVVCGRTTLVKPYYLLRDKRKCRCQARGC